MANLTFDSIELEWHTHVDLDDQFTLSINTGLKIVVIKIADRKNGLSKPEDILALRNRPKTQMSQK